MGNWPTTAFDNDQRLQVPKIVGIVCQYQRMIIEKKRINPGRIALADLLDPMATLLGQMCEASAEDRRRLC